MTFNSSAMASLVGYLYQLRFALHLLLDSEEEAEISIEWIDDIALEKNGGAFGQLQLKHHKNRVGSLSDTSPDLWKTIRIWSESVKSKKFSPATTSFTLITTATAPEDSIAALLKSGPSRNVKLAIGRLIDVAKSSKNTISRIKEMTTMI